MCNCAVGVQGIWSFGEYRPFESDIGAMQYWPSKLPFLETKLTIALKVPKREIFDRSDFPDFYTIKSLSVGDFGVKIKKNLKNI